MFWSFRGNIRFKEDCELDRSKGGVSGKPNEARAHFFVLMGIAWTALICDTGQWTIPVRSSDFSFLEGKK